MLFLFKNVPSAILIRYGEMTDTGVTALREEFITPVPQRNAHQGWGEAEGVGRGHGQSFSFESCGRLLGRLVFPWQEIKLMSGFQAEGL